MPGRKSRCIPRYLHAARHPSAFHRRGSCSHWRSRHVSLHLASSWEVKFARIRRRRTRPVDTWKRLPWSRERTSRGNWDRERATRNTLWRFRIVPPYRLVLVVVVVVIIVRAPPCTRLSDSRGGQNRDVPLLHNAVVRYSLCSLHPRPNLLRARVTMCSMCVRIDRECERIDRSAVRRATLRQPVHNSQ